MKRNRFIKLLAWGSMCLACSAALAATPEEDYNKGMEYVNAGNPAEGAPYFQAAAEQGYAPAQSALGVCYGNGFGVVRDEAESVRWFRLAAEQGYAKAQHNLACC